MTERLESLPRVLGGSTFDGVDHWVETPMVVVTPRFYLALRMAGTLVQSVASPFQIKTGVNAPQESLVNYRA